MNSLLEAAKAYLLTTEGNCPHTPDQDFARSELRNAVAREQGIANEAGKHPPAPEGNTSAGATGTGVGQAVPKVTVGQAMAQIAKEQAVSTPAVPAKPAE